jgi:hypothetical protein
VATSRYPFAFTPAYRLAAAAFGVSPGRAWVEVDELHSLLTARYGPWLVRTDLGNVLDTQLTGPYNVVKTIGPAHLSLADRGLTMASNPRRGLCIRFTEPVQGIEPTGRIKHPALTVTVADCAALAAALAAAGSSDSPSR